MKPLPVSALPGRVASRLLFALLLGSAPVAAQSGEKTIVSEIAPTTWSPPTGPLPVGLPCSPPKHDKIPGVPQGTRPVDSPPGQPAQVGGALSPQAFTVFRNTVAKPSGAATSTVCEPTTSHVGGAAFTVGNWFAARSSDDGASWSYVNPYTKFSSADGGFCCDQYTIGVPNYNMVVWELLYLYSPTTQKNTIRLACMIGGGNVGAASVAHYYDISAAVAGYGPGNWIDYPQLSCSDRWLYLSGNVFTASGGYAGSMVVRLGLAQMALGVSAPAEAFVPISSSPRCSYGLDDTMFIAGHLSTTSLRIHTWPDSGARTSVDRTINTWYPGMTPQPGPDSVDFLQRCDNRITTGYHNVAEVGFYWTSNLGGPYPRPFVRGVRFDRRNDLNVLSDENIWSSANAWAYPACATNVAGHVALLCAYGGGVYNAGCDVFLRDSINCAMGENQTIAAGNAGPSAGFGDYFSVQRHPLFPMTFVAAASCQRNGTANSNAEPHNVHFGRTLVPTPLFDLDVSSATPTGASVTVSQRDNYCQQNGVTPFARTYAQNASITLTAPTTLGTRSFYRWRVDGVDQAPGLSAVTVVMNVAHAVVAVYGNFTTPAVTTLGSGCSGSNGIPTLVTSSAPSLGLSYDHKLTNAPVNRGAYLVFGASKTSWPPLTLPFTLPSTTCRFYCDEAVTLGTIVPPGGAYVWNLTIPNSVSLLGGKFYTQCVNLDIGANLWSLTTSNALEETIGGWNLN